MSIPRPNEAARRWPRALALALLVALPATVGCRGLGDQLAYNETIDNAIVGVKNHFRAKEAWQRRELAYCDLPYLHDFEKGFKDGYKDIANGGEPCLPLFPPRIYWGHQFRSAEGQSRIQAWFAGWKEGAAAAQEDGAGLFSDIPLGSKPTPDPLDVEYAPVSPNDAPERIVSDPPPAPTEFIAPPEPLPAPPQPMPRLPESQRPRSPQPEPDRLGPDTGGPALMPAPWIQPEPDHRTAPAQWLSADEPPLIERSVGPITPLGGAGLPPSLPEDASIFIESPRPSREQRPLPQQPGTPSLMPPRPAVGHRLPPSVPERQDFVPMPRAERPSLPPSLPEPPSLEEDPAAWLPECEAMTNVLPWRNPGVIRNWSPEANPQMERLSRLPPSLPSYR
jgi:hypothetical protein